jgi:hypothetical protein
MKIYSDSAVTSSTLDSVAASFGTKLVELDVAQSRQIKQLRIVVAVSAIVNLALTAVLYVQLYDLASLLK